MTKPESTNESIENESVESTTTEEQVELKITRVKSLKTSIKGGWSCGPRSFPNSADIE